MTEIAFHFNVVDKLDYACRLLRKAYRSGAQVAVTGPAGLLGRLDAALWSFDPLDFLPHVRCAAGQSLEPRMAGTPLVLVERAQDAAHRGVLVNLGTEVPLGFESFERLIEIVGSDDEDRQAGRQRWKHFVDRGYAIERHEVRASS
ncbi:MAG TPA: DNA polymerase III subunit chi [Burkholderiaceae bacterium]|jgi:DNA polymerase-3 subunit chi|nr:DNA polymerase III subunit chi [Burkholderiaceae bacterium]